MKGTNDMERLTEYGYAKINLHLDVTGRLEGGYHRVETVMQTISLCDQIELQKSAGKDITVSCNVSGVPLDEKNLAVRAANLFFERVGARHGLAIEIDKKIPMAAGMAGGSADAAAVLRGLNRLNGSTLSFEELCALGSHLGADVPFCIVGGTAYADGRGDQLHPFPSMPHCYILCACEGESVSTPWAYAVLDQIFGNFAEGGSYQAKGCDALRSALEEKSLEKIAAASYNIFEEPVLALRPVAARIRQILLESGAHCAKMSGSGPSVFGIFSDEGVRDLAREFLEKEGYKAYSCHPVGDCIRTV